MKMMLASKVILALLLLVQSKATDYEEDYELAEAGADYSDSNQLAQNWKDGWEDDDEDDDVIADDDTMDEFEDYEEEDAEYERSFGMSVDANADHDIAASNNSDDDYGPGTVYLHDEYEEDYEENDEDNVEERRFRMSGADYKEDYEEDAEYERSFGMNLEKYELATEGMDNFHLAEEGGIEGEWNVVMKEPEGFSAFSVEALESFAFEVAELTGSTINIMSVYTSALQGFSVRGMTEKAARKFTKDKRVAFVEQNGVVKADAVTWGVDRVDQRNLPLDNSYAPVNNRNGSGVTAYIIDTGIRITHNEFKDGSGKRRVSWGTNTADAKNYDCNGHGTHVAGTVGGRTYGVAKNVDLVAVKVLDCGGSGSYAGVIAGVDWTKRNAQGKKATANLSLGGSGSRAMDTAVRNLHNSGVVTVVAAGNSNRNACSYSPAREQAVITVGATASNDYRASFSNYGSCLDIFAPGQSITAAWIRSDSDRNTISGTSMASPHVCGAVALHLQNGSSASAVEGVIKGAATRNKVRNAGSGSPNSLLFVGGGGGGGTPTRSPTRAPSPPSCISGDTGILSKTSDSPEESVTQVRDLQIGDTVRGFDSKMKPTSCKVEAIGGFGTGEVYGNYTANHFIYNQTSKKVQEHGKNGTLVITDKYDLIADCPLVEDESGVRFGPIDSDFCGGQLRNMSWKNYLLLHAGILRVVRQSGAFWFQASSYKDMSMVQKFAPRVCKNMLRCMKNNEKCEQLEKSSNKFVNKALKDSFKVKALKTFNNIGSRCKTGSVSAIVTAGASVDASLIGTASC